MQPRRKVKVVRAEAIPPDTHWSQLNGFTENDTLPPGMGEGDLQELCEDVARRYGWTVYHNNDSRRSDKGLPDLIMLSPVQWDGTVVLAMIELKDRKRKLTQEQEVWIALLQKATAIVTGVMRPQDWGKFITLCFDPSGEWVGTVPTEGDSDASQAGPVRVPGPTPPA